MPAHEICRLSVRCASMRVGLCPRMKAKTMPGLIRRPSNHITSCFQQFTVNSQTGGSARLCLPTTAVEIEPCQNYRSQIGLCTAGSWASISGSETATTSLPRRPVKHAARACAAVILPSSNATSPLTITSETPFRIAVGLLERRRVADGGGIEHRDVGFQALPQHAAIAHARAAAPAMPTSSAPRSRARSTFLSRTYRPSTRANVP